MKKRMTIVLGGLLIVLGSSYAMAGELSGEVVRVGMMPSAVGAPVQYAIENGYFEEEGIEVETLIFPNGGAINEAVAAGEMDVCCSGAATVFALANGSNVLLGDVEMSGGMGIWAREGDEIFNTQGEIEAYPEMYGTADVIKGKSFLCSLGTASQFNVLRYVQQFGLTDGDIELINMDWGAAVQAFSAGEGDYIATFAPYSFQAEEAGGVQICTFEDATETALYDMVFAPKSVVEKRRADIVAFLKAFYRATDELAKDDEKRSSFSMEWFASEGREYDEETMAQEIKDRPYVTYELLQSDEYILGDAMYSYAEFNVGIEKIDESQLEYMKTCYDSSLISEAVGFEVKQPEL